MRCREGLINTCVLRFKLLKIVYVNDRITKLIKVTLNIFELLLVESKRFEGSELTLLIIHWLNV